MPSGVSKKRRERFADLIAATEVPLESFIPADGVLLMTRFFSEEFPEAMSLLASWVTRPLLGFSCGMAGSSSIGPAGRPDSRGVFASTTDPEQDN